MMIKIDRFARKPFHVDAVKVTEENINEVAAWCGGEVHITNKPEGGTEEKYIKVKVHRPMTERQTKAYVGDRVLFAGTGFKVYNPTAFENSFDPVPDGEPYDPPVVDDDVSDTVPEPVEAEPVVEETPAEPEPTEPSPMEESVKTSLENQVFSAPSF